MVSPESPWCPQNPPRIPGIAPRSSHRSGPGPLISRYTSSYRRSTLRDAARIPSANRAASSGRDSLASNRSSSSLRLLRMLGAAAKSLSRARKPCLVGSGDLRCVRRSLTFLSEDELSRMRAPPDPAEFYKDDEDSASDDEQTDPVGAFPGTGSQYGASKNQYF